MKSNYFEAIATLIGTVIGAGILGIPFVIAKAGFITGTITIILIGLAVLAMNYFYGVVILNVKGKHQLTGYARILLGKWAKRIAAFSLIFGIYGAMIAYLIGEGRALSNIFSGNPLIFSLLFFIFVSIIVFIGIKAVANSELFMVVIVLFIVLLISVLSFTKINVTNLVMFNPLYLALPYGVVLFAFLGASAIPEMKIELGRQKNKLLKAIVIGSLIPIAVYIIFSLIVVGVCGGNTSEIATTCLGEHIGSHMIIFGNLFAVFAMATSSIALALALKQMYWFDFKLNKNLAWALTMFIPLIIFLLGMHSFIKTIAITGSVAGGVDGILITLMYWKIKKSKKTLILGTILVLMFVGGLIYTILQI